MKNKFIQLLSFVFFFGVTLASAQTVDYNFRFSTGTYTPLPDPPAGSTILTPVADDWEGFDLDLAQRLPFAFQLFGESHDSIYISNGIFFDRDQYISIEVPMGEVRSRGAGASPISIATEGNVGNRIVKVQWANVGFDCEFFENATTTAFANFQVWLYEDSNKVEIHVGPSLLTGLNGIDECFEFLTAGVSHFIDLPGVNDSVRAVYAAGDPTAPSAARLFGRFNFESPAIWDTLAALQLTGFAQNGAIFTFVPVVVPSTNRVISSTLNQLRIAGNPVADQLVLQNIGQNLHNTQAVVRDVTGREVYRGQLGTVTQNENILVPATQLAPGMYLLQIQSTEGSQTLRFIKQ